MRNHLLLFALLGGMTALTAGASVSGVRWNKTWNAETKTLIENSTDRTADWMADLPDNMLIAHVSIPSAHDFATGEGWVGKSTGTGPLNSTCQSAKIIELLDGGIRGVDLRPGYYSSIVSSNRNLYMCHGTDVTDVTFEAGIKQIADFLEAHPTEFIIAHIFRGNNGNEPEASNRIYNEVLNKYRTYVADFKPNLTVKDMRGKIVFIVRDRASYLAHESQADIQNWRTQFNDNQRPARINLHGNAELSTRLHVQDISSTSEGNETNKNDHLLNLLMYAQNQDTPTEMYAINGYYTSEWVMNFTSMQTSAVSSSRNYRQNATRYNGVAADYLNEENLGKGPLGMVFGDYLLNSSTNGDRLVYKVIENNFTGGENAPVVRYAIDPDIDWDVRPENEFAGKKLFLRNVGASEDMNYYKYFGGGADWGAHAIANYAGHPVEFVKGDNGIRIVSPFGALQNKDGEYYCDPTDNEDMNGTEFVLTRTWWDGYPVFHITGQVSQKRIEARLYNEGENVYFDQPKYKVFPGEPSDDPHQMWQLIALSPKDEVPGITIDGHDRISRLKNKANPERGMDATFLIPAYSFGNNDDGITKWTLTKGNIVTAGQAATAQGGMWRAFNSLRIGDNTFSLSTIVPNLPRGHYKLEFQYLSTGDGVTYRLGERTPEQLAANSSGVAGVNAGEDNVQAAGDWFKANENNGRVVFEFDKVTDETNTRELEFKRAAASSGAASFYLDNLRLTYYGDNVEPTVIELTFPQQWNTMILPFEAEVPAGLEVYEATGIGAKASKDDLEYHLITLSQPVAKIKANYPYVVRNPKNAVSERPIKGARRVAADQTVYTFRGYPTNRKNDYLDAAGVLTGLTEPRGLDAVASQAYPLTTSTSTNEQYFNRLQGDETYNHAGRRAYLNGRTTPDIQASRVYFSMDDVITDIDDLIGDDAVGAGEPADVFNLQGMAVRTGVEFDKALTGLPAGVYILKTRSNTFKVVKD